MRLMKRCMDLLALLRAARWLTTSQVRRRFFPRASLDAARKRLRQLTKAGYLKKHQEDRMREALFALGPEGKRVLEENGAPAIVLERQPPKQLAHLLGVNTVRIAAELTGQLGYFFAAWELPGIGWKHQIVPDAVFRLAGRTYAVEYDRGVEGLRYFLRSKVRVYRRGLPGLALAAVLIVADRKARMESLASAVADKRDLFLFTTIDLIRRHGILARIFYQLPGGDALALFPGCSVEPSPRREGFGLATPGISGGYGKQRSAY